MKFSIAMATFNGARFVEEQLDSFAAQTLLPSELVVCDDGSSDRTLALIESFARRAPFEVRIERNDRQLGVSANFLKAASLCRHDWIAFSDQDDVWDRAKLETVHSFVGRREGVLLVAHRATMVDDRLRPTGGLLHVPPARRLTIIPRLGHNFWLYPYGFTMVFSARLIREFPAETRPIDSYDRWVFALSTALGETAYLPQSLALYRRHGNNYSQPHSPVPWSTGLLDPRTALGFVEAADQLRAFSDYLKSAARSASPTDAGLLLDSAKKYQRLSRRFIRRSELFGPQVSGLRQMRTYLDMLLSGAYASHRRGGLGLRAGVKDAAHVVFRHAPALRAAANAPPDKTP